VTTPVNSTTRVTLEDVIALNREIAAMVRAGIPLELGLRGFSGGLNHRLSQLANRIADHLSQGLPLATAIQLEGEQENSIYSAVIEAGVESGRLADALEAVARSAEAIRDSRRQLALALVYPTLVCLIGFVLLAGFVWMVIPQYLAAARDFGADRDWPMIVLEKIHSSSAVWIWLIPFLVAVGFIARRLLRRGAPLGRIGRSLDRATFAELLQLQVAQGVPMGPAVQRAGAATRDQQLHSAAALICQEMESGKPFSAAVASATQLPPMMRWMLSAGSQQGTLAQTLVLLRDSYRRRAQQQAWFLRVWLPSLLTMGIGGTVALIYSLMLFLPLRALWEALMQE